LTRTYQPEVKYGSPELESVTPRILIGKRSDIQDGEFTNVMVGGRQILLANIHGSYFATANICTHEGAELHKGEIDDKEIACPWHGAKWDLTTGQLIWFSEFLEPIRSYKVIVEDDALFIEI
jgi:nitrite reductase/ring-hydroxylating ferredoxin subunit